MPDSEIEGERHFVMDRETLSRSRKLMWVNIMGYTDIDPFVASKIRMMTDKEKFEFLLGKNQVFKVPAGLQNIICTSLRSMYVARKQQLYDEVF